jgi:HSP20 family protein
MNLLPWHKADVGLSQMRRQLDRLFEDFFTNGGVAAARAWAPELDVAETPEAIVVKAELPGIDPKEVEISVSGETLSIRGEKKEEKEEKGKTWHRVERSYGSFLRSIDLPAPVDAERISAEAKDGVLTVTLPKTEKARARRIEVKTEK